MTLARRKTYYDLLGVKRTATLDDIKKAYREVARIYHPDSNFFDEIIESEPSEVQVDTFKKINEAYETLSDLARRSRYDQSLPPELADWESDSDSDAFAHNLKYKKQFRFDDSVKNERERRPTFGQVDREEFLQEMEAQEASNDESPLVDRGELPLPKPPSHWKRALIVVMLGLLMGVGAVTFATFFNR